MIRNKIASKHQKLIKQCYPPGAKGLDKRPNASELSYLLYYVSTRRVKLTKVANYLEKLTRTDVYRERVGNVQVTLEIINALIERCHEDLNLFAPNVVHILLDVLPKTDISLASHAVKVFATFSKFHNGDLFSGDSSYVKSFQDLILQFLSLANRKTSNSKITTSSGIDLDLQWVQISMEAAKSVASSLALATNVGQTALKVIIPSILNTLSLAQDSNGSSLLQLQQQVMEGNDIEDVSVVRRKSYVPLPTNIKENEEVNDGEDGDDDYSENDDDDYDENDDGDDDNDDDQNNIPTTNDISNPPPILKRPSPQPPAGGSSFSSKTKRIFGHVTNNATNVASYAANTATNAVSVASTTAMNVATTAGNTATLAATSATLAATSAVNAATSTLNLPINSRVSFSSHRTTQSSPDDDSNFTLENEILITSLKALMYLFDTTTIIQIRHSALSIVSYIMENNSPTSWSNVLIQLTTSWSPVQLRFVILSSLVEKFVGLRLDNLPLQWKLAHLIKSLLSSSVNMVGLSVMDIQRSLLHHQQRLILADKQEYNNMIIATRNALSALASHHYYTDQISDMVAELLSRCVHGGSIGSGGVSSSMTTNSEETPTTQQQVSKALPKVRDALLTPELSNSLIINDLRNVREILDIVAQNKDSYTVRVPLTVWEGTQGLLSHDNPKVISEFTLVLVKYLQSDLLTVDGNKNLTKNSSEKITLTKFIQISFTIIKDSSSSTQSILSLYNVLIKFINAFGIHSIVRIIPQLWSVEELAIESEHGSSTTITPNRGVELTTITLSLLSTIGKVLSLSDFTNSIEEYINNRKTQNAWYSPIENLNNNNTKSDLNINLNALTTTTPVDRRVLLEQFNIDNKLISDETKTEIFENISAHLFNGDNTDVPTTAGVQVTKARSFKQLKGPISLHSMNSNSNIIGLANGSAAETNESRRVFTPRVNDLRRAVSGALLNGENSISELRQAVIANRNRTNSTNSSSLSVHSASSKFEEKPKDLNDFREGVDLNSFLSALTINSTPERGRLAI